MSTWLIAPLIGSSLATASATPGGVPAPVALDGPHAAREVDLSKTTFADRSATATDTPVVVSGPWRVVQTVGGTRTWEAPLPVRTRTLFFHRPPSGMKLMRRDDASAPWRVARSDSWRFDTHSLRVRRPATAGPPPPGLYGLTFPRAQERESALRTAPTGSDDPVVRSLQVDDTTRHGLLLLPGTTVRVTVDVPPDGELRFDALGIPPEAADPAVARDGQALEVQLDAGGAAPVALASLRPLDGLPSASRLSLAPWAGQTVTLTFAAPPDGVDHHDAVLVADPVVLQPDPDPPLLVVVFIDTLRQDALGLYGNSVPTSPGIDAWAADAAVFTEARSVAPWTLPTARSLFSGVAPELWGVSADLPTRLRSAGWASAFIAGNIYLSSNFDMADGWTEHRCINWPQAEVQVDRARRWLDDHADRPALMVLHLMDMHLPYTEPDAFRHRFAGPAPAPFTEDVFHRNQVVQWQRDLDDAGREWLRGRYHNNLAYIDSLVAPFLRDLPESATVLVLSDHGEEFWDHGDFEHGHTLYDELLRVPLVVKGPGLPAGTYDTPVSLLDVTPTLLRVAGVEASLDGVALQDIIAAPPETYAERPIGFGRPLYGDRRWGVVKGDHKYTTWRSTEVLVDLSEDPEETNNLVDATTDTAHWRGVLSEALRTPVHLAYTLSPQRRAKSPDTTVELVVPGGIRAAWSAEDPTRMSEVTTTIDGDTVVHTWAGKQRGTRQAYVVPSDDPLTTLPDTTITVQIGDTREVLPVPSAPPTMDGRNHVLGRTRVEGRAVSLQLSVVPLPPDASVGIEGFDAEVEAELEALGYLDH